MKGLKEEIAEVREGVERARGVLEGIASGGGIEEEDGDVKSLGEAQGLGTKEERRRKRDKMVWEVIEREVGDL